MRRALPRTFSVACLAVVMVLLMTATALAHSCTPVNKPVGAGQGGTATVDVVTGAFTITSIDLNAAGKMKGNFITVSVVSGTTVLDQVDTFGRKDLPEGAHNAGPGDSECDGVGIDDAAECA